MPLYGSSVEPISLVEGRKVIREGKDGEGSGDTPSMGEASTGLKAHYTAPKGP